MKYSKSDGLSQGFIDDRQQKFYSVKCLALPIVFDAYPFTYLPRRTLEQTFASKGSGTPYRFQAREALRTLVSGGTRSCAGTRETA